MPDLKKKILAAVAADLAAIEQALERNLTPHFDLVARVAEHLLFAGGKRLRPLLMLLSARVCGLQSSASVVDYAAIFEYLHAATLLHDDVVDGGRIRRGKPTAHYTWDAPTAVLTGDFLLARCLSLAARTGNPQIIQIIAYITEQMSQGEIEQLAHKSDPYLSEAIYMEVIRCKTAVLFQGTCRVGAILANAADTHVQAMDDYGYHLGMAFQMADDLLDYVQDAATLGKLPGADLREGKLTLPVIHALSQAEAADRQWMIDTIQSVDFSSEDFKRLLELMTRYNGIAYTRQRAAVHIQSAKAAITVFDATVDRDILYDIVDYAWSRAS